MSFAEILDGLPAKSRRFCSALKRCSLPNDGALGVMAQHAHSLTLQNFGRTMRLFAPLYLSERMHQQLPLLRIFARQPHFAGHTRSRSGGAEARHLAAQGFRQILLVAGEHPKFVSQNYLAECVRALAPHFPSISIEVGPMETADYIPLVEAGAEGLVVYQETYNREVYAAMHTSGPKRDFDWRLDCAERGYAAGFRRLGIGALIGLALEGRSDRARGARGLLAEALLAGANHGEFAALAPGRRRVSTAVQDG